MCNPAKQIRSHVPPTSSTLLTTLKRRCRNVPLNDTARLFYWLHGLKATKQRQLKKSQLLPCNIYVNTRQQIGRDPPCNLRQEGASKRSGLLALRMGSIPGMRSCVSDTLALKKLSPAADRSGTQAPPASSPGRGPRRLRPVDKGRRPGAFPNSIPLGTPAPPGDTGPPRRRRRGR